MRADVIPAYPYSIYKDDDNIAVFFKGFNQLAQDYIDSFNALKLPVYKSKVNALLDWVGLNIYGIARPVFPVGIESIRGELNNLAFNEIALNELIKKYPENFIVASDDVYKRVITWHHYKGDGDGFNIRTLKRKVMRFLTDSKVSQTYQVSVSFGLNNEVNLIIYQNGRMPLHPSAIINDSALSESPLNELNSVAIDYTAFELSHIFKTAVDTGVLELPFQYSWNVTII